MRVPQIRMESQFAKIKLSQKPAYIEIKQANADVSIEQPKASMSFQSSKGKLTIDQTEAWEQMNKYSAIRATEKIAQEGKTSIQEGIARRAEEGASLINIHEKTNHIAELAARNGHRQMKQLGIGFIPKPFSVKVSYEKGFLDIDVTPNTPIIHVQVRKPEVTYHPGIVDVSMEVDASLHIDYTNKYEDERRMIGG